MVSPVPSIGNVFGKYMNTSLGFAFLKGKIKKSKVYNREGINKFLESIGREKIPDNEEMYYYLVQNNNNRAVLGCGHFVSTFKAKVFENTHTSNFLFCYLNDMHSYQL